MAAGGGAFEIVLERDGHGQPWGFRLQGGQDVGIPLSVQRVLVGSPADGVLKKGDVILRIGKYDTKNISHQQAADLFANHNGNDIQLLLKRAGKATTNTVSGSAGVARTSDTQLLNSLSKTRTPKAPTIGSGSSHDTFSIQNQPYRTAPLIQPSVRVISDLDPGSAAHLKRQAAHITSAAFALVDESEEEANVTCPAFQPERAQHFAMQQKVTGTLQNLNSYQPGPPQPTATNLPQPDQLSFKPVSASVPKPVSAPVPKPTPAMQPSRPMGGSSKQVYNNPINLYSAENVAEVAKMNEMGFAPVAPALGARPLNPQKPQQVILNPPKDYNPQESATWQALQEVAGITEMDMEKARNYCSLKEHDPVYSDIYTPKHPQPPKNPQGSQPNQQYHNPANFNSNAQTPRGCLQSPGGVKSPRSPVADLLPSSMTGYQQQEVDHPSPVVAATMAEPSGQYNPNNIIHNMPIYETNAIGGRKRITQSATFNKVMMDVLGE